jgi:hypothetical protein
MKRIKSLKKTRSVRPQKFVRVDPRTIVEVDANTPDIVVKERYAQHQVRDFTPHKDIDFFR